MSNADEPVGLHCPGCGQHARMMLTGNGTAFCGNDDCNMLCWDPRQSLAQISASVSFVDLNDTEGEGS